MSRLINRGADWPNVEIVTATASETRRETYADSGDRAHPARPRAVRTPASTSATGWVRSSGTGSRHLEALKHIRGTATLRAACANPRKTVCTVKVGIHRSQR